MTLEVGMDLGTNGGSQTSGFNDLIGKFTEVI
jgi:hypothetical protein